VSNGTALVLSGTGQITSPTGNITLNFIAFAYIKATGVFNANTLSIVLPITSLVGYNGGAICSFPTNARSCGTGTGWSTEIDSSGICKNLNLGSCNVWIGKPRIPVYSGGTGAPIDIPDAKDFAISGTLTTVKTAEPKTKMARPR
jgi:hypothetical protein